MKKLALIIPILLSSCAASTADLPAADNYIPAQTKQAKPPKPPTMWVVRVECMKGDFLIPIPLAKDYGLRPGAWVSIETARLLARELGADYPQDILDALERLEKGDAPHCH